MLYIVISSKPTKPASFPLRIPPESIIGGLDSHSPELGIIPGAFVFPIGYTAGACALANDGLTPCTIPQTIKLELEGKISNHCDAKDMIWNLLRKHFSGSEGNGRMVEIGGEGYAKLPFVEAAKIFNAVTEFGGIGAIGTTLNPQVIAYLRKYGSNLDGISDRKIQRIFDSIQPDEGAIYDDVISFDIYQN